MAQCVIDFKGTVVLSKSICRLTSAEPYPSKESEAHKRSEYDANSIQDMGDSFLLPTNGMKISIVEEYYSSVEDNTEHILRNTSSFTWNWCCLCNHEVNGLAFRCWSFYQHWIVTLLKGRNWAL